MTMTISEAREVWAHIDPTERVIDTDGKIEEAKRVLVRYREAFQILNGEPVRELFFLSEKESTLLQKAVNARSVGDRPTGKPTLEKAEAILAANMSETGRVILDDIEADVAARVVRRACEVEAVLDGRGGKYDYLTPKEVNALKTVAKGMSRSKQQSAEKASFWKRLFRRNKRVDMPFNWKDSLNWQDVQFKKDGVILFTHRLNVEHLTSKQRQYVKDELIKRNIRFEERSASKDVWPIRQGDLTLRISDRESIECLRDTVFNWAKQSAGRPVVMTPEAYKERQKKLNDLRQVHVASEPEKSANLPLKRVVPKAANKDESR